MGRSWSTSSPAGRSSASSASALPVTWRSRTWAEPATRRLRFVHVAGATTRDGRDLADRADRDRLPRRDRARLPPAGAGLRGLRRPLVHATDRRPDAGDVQGPRRGARRSTRQSGPTPPTNRIDMSDRRRVWITGHRHHHGDRDRPSTRSGPDCGPAARRSSGSTGSTRARSARRSRPRSTTSTRSPGCRRRPPASSTGSASSGSSRGGSRSTTPG